MKKYLRVPTTRFRKDLRRLQQSGYNLSKLERIIDALCRDEKLPQHCRDHALKGRLTGKRECHIAPDWLLLYEKENDKLILSLIRTGTHRVVLGME